MKNTITIITALLFAALIVYAADVVVYPRTTGTPYSCPLPKSGSTNSYAAEDDGALQKGIAWPVPRFTVQTNTNCVLDNLTGLIWARNANQFGAVSWGAAVTNCNTLDYGDQTDWRLPNLSELRSLIDTSQNTLALPVGHPFSITSAIGNVEYWSSMTASWATSEAMKLRIFYGHLDAEAKTGLNYVWPVRGGY